MSLKVGDRIVGGVEGTPLTVTAKAIQTDTGYVVGVKSDDGAKRALTLPSVQRFEVEPYVKPGAIRHAASGGYRSATACGKSGGAIAASPPEITCTQRQCRDVLKRWQNRRVEAGTVEGETHTFRYRDETERRAEYVVPFVAAATITAHGRTFTVANKAEANALSAELKIASEAATAVASIFEAREEHPDITTAYVPEVEDDK